MGLPLFVAKVESDIPHKCPRKSHERSGSPPRTNIGRGPRVRVGRTIRDPRDRTSATRRIRALERNDLSISGTADDTPYIPNLRATVPRSAVANHISRRFVDSIPHPATEEMESLRDSSMYWFRTLFGRTWFERDWMRPQRDVHGNYWNMEEPTRTRDAQIVLINTPSTSEEPLERYPSSIRILPARSWPVFAVPSETGPEWHSQSLRSRARRERIRAEARQGLAQRVGPVTAHNGLGDRVHSPSPEAWDTLLSTLTPDPQPPSASSSFASATAASRSARASTNTSLSERHPADGIIPDGPCDSGNEDSDNAEDGSTTWETTARHRQPAVRSTRVFAPTLRLPGFIRQTFTPRLYGNPRTSNRDSGEVYTFSLAELEGREETPESRSEDDEWRAQALPDGPLPGYSAIVQATRADAPEADAPGEARETTPRRRRRPMPTNRHGAFGDIDLETLRGLEPDTLIVDRLQNNQDVPEELWAAAGVRPSWTRDNRE